MIDRRVLSGHRLGLKRSHQRPAPDICPTALRGLDHHPVEDQLAPRDPRVAFSGDRAEPRGIELRHRLLRVAVERVEQADMRRVHFAGAGQVAQGFAEFLQRWAVLDLGKNRTER